MKSILVTCKTTLEEIAEALNLERDASNSYLTKDGTMIWQPEQLKDNIWISKGCLDMTFQRCFAVLISMSDKTGKVRVRYEDTRAEFSECMWD